MKAISISKSAAICAVVFGAAANAPHSAQAGTEPYIGELMLIAGTYCPRGWLAAEGQLLPIAGNHELYAMFGSTYGGDGRTTIAVPDLRGRAPVHKGTAPRIHDL